MVNIMENKLETFNFKKKYIALVTMKDLLRQ